MSLAVFTALVGLSVAPGHIHPVIGFTALLCIAVGAGAAGALNMQPPAPPLRRCGAATTAAAVEIDGAVAVSRSALSIFAISVRDRWAA
jgi:hypothetical protein